MVAPNNPQIAQVVWQMLRDTRILENTFHLYKASGWTLADLTNAITAAYNVWNTYAKPAVPAAVSLFNVHGHVYDPHGSPWVADYPVSPAVAGTRIGTAEAGNATVAVSKRAAYAGQRYRGRFYWPALAEPDVTSADVIAPVMINLLANFGVGLFNAFGIGGANGTLVLFHKADNTFSTVQAILTDSIVDSMRRRLPGRGR